AATDTVSGFEAITGTGHGEAITLDAGGNELRGGGGNDTLRGGAGNDRFLFGQNDGADVLADAAIGDVLVFSGPDGTTAPSLARSGSAGNYTYTVTFGSTTATFISPDLLDLTTASASAVGTTTWEMTVGAGTPLARDDSGGAFSTDEETVLTTGDVLANDTDPGLANVQIVSYDAVSAHGATVTRVPGTGQFTYDPADIFDGLIDGQSGTDTFTYTVSDGTTTTTATVTINIAGFTDNPVAYADSATTTEDAPVTIDALANDLDPGAQDAVVTQYDSTGTGGGTVVYNGDGTFTYTPGAGFNSLGVGETGTDSFTYTLDDGRYASTTTVTVTVTGVDDLFTAQDDSRILLEDQVATLDVLANDTDPDGDPVSLVSVGTPNVGTAQIVNGQIVYPPPLNYNGPVTFTYDATDGVSTQTATVSLNYVAVDDAPTIVNDTVTATIGRGPVVIDAVANDIDPEGGAITIWGANAWSHQAGPVQIIDNQIVWNPASNLGPGTYQLYYAIRDEAGHNAYSGEISVTLIDEQAPYAVNYIVQGSEDAPLTVSGTASFFDRNGDTLTVVSIQTENIANATVTDNGDGTFTVTPDANFVGTVYVPVVVSDGIHEVAHTQQVLFNNTYDPVTLHEDIYRIRPDELLTVHTADLLANDVNPDGALNGFVTSAGFGLNGTVTGYAGESQTANYASHSHPGIMTGPSAILLSQSGGRVNFTPDAGFHGIATFEYNFFERAIHAYTPVNGTVSVYVDRDVAAADDTAATAEDTAVVINVLANDSDADGDAMVVHRVDQPANGSAEVLPDGTIRYTPVANFSGTETITYYVGSEFQPESAASTAIITVTVTPVNDPITAVDDSVTTAEDQQVVLDLTGNDLNPDGFTGAVLSVGTPAHGAIVQTGQTITYVPDADFNGTDSFSYTREDGLGGTTTATVTVSVTAVNDAPVANADSVTVAEDGSLTFDPRGNDSDPEATALSVTALGTPAHGSAQINADGTVTYVPDANYFGSDSFTYTVSDGELTATATIAVAVQPVQDVPVAVDDSAITAEDTAVVINVIANDTELDGQALAVTAVTGAANGQVHFSGGRITYTPDADFNGAEQLTYTVSDGNGGTASATVDITVTPVNDAPAVMNDSSSAVQSATQTLDPLANDSDVDGGQLSITALNGTAVQPGQFVSLANGALVFLNGDGTVSLFPGGNYDHLTKDQNAVETVSYTVSDGAGGMSTGSIQFTVTGINDAPVAVPDSVSTQEDIAVTLGVLGNDTDAEGNPLTLTAVADPANGAVSFTAAGSITYTPDLNFNGTEVITYTVSDGQGGSSTGILTVNVAPVNDLPVAANDTAATNEDTAVTIDVLSNDSDAESSSLLIAEASNGSNGTVEIVNGQLVYTPEANFFGTDSFTYRAGDGQGGTAQATVTVTVKPVQDAPLAAPDSAVTTEDTAITIDVTANDTELDGEALTVTGVTGAANGQAQFTGGQITYTPDADFNGSEQLVYTVSDGNGGTATATLDITVTAINDAPVANADSVTVAEDGSLTFDPRGNDRDPDSAALSVTSLGKPGHGSVQINSDGTVTYVPTVNYFGHDSFTYVLSDGALVSTGTVTVVVQPVQDAPLAAPDSIVTAEDSPVTIDVTANDAELDGDFLVVTGVTGARNGQAEFFGGQVTYTPDADFNGSEQLIYTVSDGNGGTATATLDITVTAVNDAPEVANDTAVTTEDSTVSLAPLANDSDPEGSALVITSLDGTPVTAGEGVSLASGAIATLNADGTVTFDPNGAYDGLQSGGASAVVRIPYTVADAGGRTSTGAIEVTVTGVNNPAAFSGQLHAGISEDSSSVSGQIAV
ncbi:MAG: beta strand repeat-containing protein, partial [Tateyamaria sp.]